jgi:molybdate transport system substrate-binding protein
MRFFLLFLSSFLFAKEILVAAAANTSFVMPKIISSFESKYHQKVKLILSSSGKLTAQILKKAPYAVFLSADMKYPLKIYKLNRSLTKPRVYAKGAIVWYYLKEFNPKVVAIASPRVAPYGKRALEYLRKSKIIDKVKLVYAPTISAVAMYVDNKGVDSGIIAKSMMFKLKGSFKEIDSKYYTPIDQGVVLLREEGREFYNFLFSKEAKEIFKKYGYIVDGL